MDRLPLPQKLETLQLLLPKVPPASLKKCCKSNPNLRSLHLGYACVQKNLVDILATHCKNLEVLKFGMTTEAADYKPLARLPKLRELSHCGIRRSGSFEPLLSELAAKCQLTHLSIDGGSLTPEEACQLVRIQSLRRLTCFCSSLECVEMLGGLANLEELCLWMSCPLDISNGLLTIIASCRRLRLLRLAVGNVNKNFFNDAIDLIRMEQAPSQQPPLKLEIPAVGRKQEVSHQVGNISSSWELLPLKTFHLFPEHFHPKRDYQLELISVTLVKLNSSLGKISYVKLFPTFIKL